jgi:hypothetical protein
MSSSPTATSSVRFPPTAGKVTITTSAVASKKTDNMSSSVSKSKVSTGVNKPSASQPKATGVGKPSAAQPKATGVGKPSAAQPKVTASQAKATGVTKPSATQANPSPPQTRVLGAKGAFTRAKTIVGLDVSSAESSRMRQDSDRVANWKRWGPYLSERQWATVREDYSPHGNW